MINTVLPIYSSDDYTLRRKKYFSAQMGKLWSPVTKLLPFQVALSSSYTTLTSIKAHNAITGSVVKDLTSSIESADWVLNTFTSPDKIYLQYTGASVFKSSYALPNGTYYLVLVTNVGTYYSDNFTGSIDVLAKGKFIKVEFYNSKDIDDTEPICYQDSWKQVCYLDTDIKGSSPKYIEEVEERDGLEVLKSRSVIEVRRMRITAPESLYRALIRLPLHDTITITDKDTQAYTAENVKVVEPVWSGASAFCRMTIEFTTGAATTKNTNLNMS